MPSTVSDLKMAWFVVRTLVRRAGTCAGTPPPEGLAEGDGFGGVPTTNLRHIFMIYGTPSEHGICGKVPFFPVAAKGVSGNHANLQPYMANRNQVSLL